MSGETTDPTEPEPGDVSPTGDTDGRFDAAYVIMLRAENAQRRTKAKVAETAREAAEAQLKAARERLLGLEVASATAGVLADPSDLLAHVAASDLIDENGNPDPEGIREAADSLLEASRTLRRGHRRATWGRGRAASQPKCSTSSHYCESARGSTHSPMDDLEEIYVTLLRALSAMQSEGQNCATPRDVGVRCGVDAHTAGARFAGLEIDGLVQIIEYESAEYGGGTASRADDYCYRLTNDGRAAIRPLRLA
jgi:hypothetical protein